METMNSKPKRPKPKDSNSDAALSSKADSEQSKAALTKDSNYHPDNQTDLGQKHSQDKLLRQSFEIQVTLADVQISKRPEFQSTSNFDMPKEDNKIGSPEFDQEHPVTQGGEDESHDGCSQQNQTSGFAQNNAKEYGEEEKDYESEKAGDEEEYDEEQQDENEDEYDAEEQQENDEEEVEQDQEDPENLIVYPKKPEGEAENLTFQGKFDQQMPVKEPILQFDAAVDDSYDQINGLPSADFNVPERETGRDTADLLSHSEMQKQRKRSNVQTDGFADELEIKKQSHSANLNMLSYQTANFGARAKQNEEAENSKEKQLDSNSKKKGFKQQKLSKDGSKEKIDQNKMFASMSDLNFVAAPQQSGKLSPEKKQKVKAEETDQLSMTGKTPLSLPLFNRAGLQKIISSEQREQMIDISNSWKVRTATIDDIHISIQATIEQNPDLIMREAEGLLEFFISLLSDQNFKIVLMTLSIVNLVISMPQHLNEDQPSPLLRQKIGDESLKTEKRETGLSSQCLSRCIPRLVSKLSDSKNIIRQQAIRALMGIFLIMKAKAKVAAKLDKDKAQISASKPNTAAQQNNFISLVLPYLYNSSSWHIREELLNVLIICFLKSKNFYEFDPYKIFEALLQMLDDSKDRIRFTALEAIVAFVSIGNKLSAKEIINQLADKQISELISERLEASADMTPYLNENGALELPYLEHIELAANQMMLGQNQRREGLNSGPAGQIKSLSSHPLNLGKRGSSSGRKNGTGNNVCPPSANSLANAVQNANSNKRTASANNPKDFQGQLSVKIGSAGVGMGNLALIQSPIYNAFGNSTNTGNQQFGEPGISGGNFNPNNQQFNGSMRNNHRMSNERVSSGNSLFLPQLQKQNSVKTDKHETPSHNIQQASNFYGAVSNGQQQSPAGPLLGVQIKGPPSSENRFYSHQSEPGSSFYSSNYQRKVSANSNYNHLLSAPGNMMIQGGPTPSGSFIYNGGPPIINNLSNHPIHLLSKETAENTPHSMVDVGLGFDDLDPNGLNYLGIKHPPIQMINHYYQQSNQLSLIQQTISSQSRSGSSQNSHNLNIQQNPNIGAAQSYELQTSSSYYSRKNARSSGSNGKSFGSALQSSSNNLNTPKDHIMRTNQNSAANGSNMGSLSNGDGFPTSGGSMGVGPLRFTPESRDQFGQQQQILGGMPMPGGAGSQRKIYQIGTNGNTFYSDGSMMTNTTGTSSHIANKLLKQGKQLSVVASRHQGQEELLQHWGSGTNTGLGVMGNPRGPIKVTRQVQIKKQETQVQAPPPSQPVDLCIDSRKPKRPLGGDSYNFGEGQDDPESNPEFTYGLDNGTDDSKRVSSSQMSKRDDQESFKNLKEQDATIFSKTYMSRDELEPIKASAEKDFSKAMNNLVSNGDWNIQFDACNVIRSVCKHHQNLLLQNGATLHSLVKQLSKHADSLRSALAKVSLLTINDLFFFLKKCMDVYLEPLIKVLIKKSSDTNEFVSSEAEAVLLTMCQNCDHSKVLQVILTQQVNSKSYQQRLSICKCLDMLVQTMGNKIIFFSNSDKLIGQLANYMSDACQDVRSVAKRAFLALSHAVMDSKDLEKLLLRVLSENSYKKVRSYLDNEPQSFEQVAQANFVIKNAANGNNFVNGGQSAAFAQPNLNGAGTPASVNGSVALNQKTLNQMRAMGAAKGTLRTGIITGKANTAQGVLGQSVSGSVLPQTSNADFSQPQSVFGLSGTVDNQNLNLNIKATAIINPKKIVRVARNGSGTNIAPLPNGARPNIKLKGQSQSSTNSMSQNSLQNEQSKGQFQTQSQEGLQTGTHFMDQVKEIQQKFNMADWRSRQDAAENLFLFIEQNSQKFTTTHSKMSDVADLLCKLITDQNAKIQVSSLEKFLQMIPNMVPFLEAQINIFFGALTQNLVSTNSQVRKLSDQVICRLYESVNRSILLSPLLSAIQFQSNVRLKPQLIDHLSDYICDSCQPAMLSKQLLPVAYKLLDDSRNEVKMKTEKLLKKLYFLLGQQVIEQCPSTKLQRVIDVVLNNNTTTSNSSGTGVASVSLAAGGGTFGSVGAANLIVQSYGSSANNNNNSKNKH